MSQILSPREVAAEWFDRLWNKHDGSVAAELMVPDARAELEDGRVTCGPGEFCEFHSIMLGTIPDISVEVVEIVSEGTQVYTRWVAHGTHKGNALGFIPTDETIRFHGITWMTVVDGKIVAGGDSWNQGTLMNKITSKGRC